MTARKSAFFILDDVRVDRSISDGPRDFTQSAREIRDGRRVGETRRFRIEFDRCRRGFRVRFAESLRDAFCDERRTRACQEEPLIHHRNAC